LCAMHGGGDEMGVTGYGFSDEGSGGMGGNKEGPMVYSERGCTLMNRKLWRRCVELVASVRSHRLMLSPGESTTGLLHAVTLIATGGYSSYQDGSTNEPYVARGAGAPVQHPVRRGRHEVAGNCIRIQIVPKHYWTCRCAKYNAKPPSNYWDHY
jgi:hypothetical protein